MKRLSPASRGVFVVILLVVGVRLGMAALDSSAASSPLVTQANGGGLTIASQAEKSSSPSPPVVREAVAIVPPEALLPDALAALPTPEASPTAEAEAADTSDAPRDADAAAADTAIPPTATEVPPTPVPPTPTPIPPTATPVPPTATPRPPTPTPLPPTTATRVPLLPVATPTVPLIPGTFTGTATPYSSLLTGNSMGCTGAGKYDPNDITTIAVAASLHLLFPCGSRMEVCGTLGCITGVRKDSCLACGVLSINLSRAGFNATCGPSANSCTVRMRQVP